MLNARCSHRFLCVSGWRMGLMVIACVHVGGLVGCGSSTSDSTPSLNSRTAVAGSNRSAISQNSNQGINRLGPLSDVSQAESTGSSNQRNRLAEKDDENNQQQSANLPESIAKDLASPDARERFRALSHWQEKGETKTSLDPVFEAMEDEDEAVRAKATAIVEQRWAAEHDRKKS